MKQVFLTFFFIPGKLLSGHFGLGVQKMFLFRQFVIMALKILGSYFQYG